MSRKSRAHEGLSLFFQRKGEPNMDGANEQTMGIFRRKCQEAGIRVKQTNPIPHGPMPQRRQFMNSKRALVNKWFDQEPLGDGQVPEALVSGKTADILPFATFKWYEWVLFWDTSVTYPDNTITIVLGRDLGPAIDIGPAMTRKILKANGKVVYRLTARSLIADEMADEAMTKERDKFDESITKRLGDSFKHKDFAADPELEDLGTPSYELY
ncbi:Reverse transcriptase (RNA-dependent DNA polymerase) [Fragilaria crotonensis]|nr:Reverse transcriptase (RNA-dependent DNA polymerase) [Fragilaria crotonensis]